MVPGARFPSERDRRARHQCARCATNHLFPSVPAPQRPSPGTLHKDPCDERNINVDRYNRPGRGWESTAGEKCLASDKRESFNSSLVHDTDNYAPLEVTASAGHFVFRKSGLVSMGADSRGSTASNETVGTQTRLRLQRGPHRRLVCFLIAERILIRVYGTVAREHFDSLRRTTYGSFQLIVSS